MALLLNPRRRNSPIEQNLPHTEATCTKVKSQSQSIPRLASLPETMLKNIVKTSNLKLSGGSFLLSSGNRYEHTQLNLTNYHLLHPPRIVKDLKTDVNGFFNLILHNVIFIQSNGYWISGVWIQLIFTALVVQCQTFNHFNFIAF